MDSLNQLAKMAVSFDQMGNINDAIKYYTVNFLLNLMKLTLLGSCEFDLEINK